MIWGAEVLTHLLHHYLHQYDLREKCGLTQERDAMVLYRSAIASLSHAAPNTPRPASVTLRRDYFCTLGQQLVRLCGNFSLSVNPVTRLCADSTYFLFRFDCSLCRQVLKTHAKVKVWFSFHIHAHSDSNSIDTHTHMCMFCSSRLTALEHGIICLEYVYEQAGSSVCFGTCLCHSASVLEMLQDEKVAQMYYSIL